MHDRIACALMLIGLAAPSFAADEAFYQSAARGGLAEIALGELASSKGSTAGVKAFGRRMAEEHRAANLKLSVAAAKSGVTLPTDLAAQDTAARDKLQSLSGKAFDLAYLESQVQAHTETIGLLEKQIASGTDPAAKAWASEMLPTVKRHAEMIGSLGQTPGEHTIKHAAGVAGRISNRQ